ncbi:hypothetical protein [Bacillus suaedaesalsae]|uniref:DUF3566 domain-containing protein n=1 Tax=Bacillus suaedaesalsae TaxID=2810349 RepID=A0ABS2DKZ1_9BACI|nr:hypothetical protein [Bacillus suaedaesalsae]MBM6619160.1 hypothetical protein [Bacillus suaedaesalsae]
MKKIEIKQIGVTSMFKTILFIGSVPLALMALIGIIITIVGVASGNTELLFFGVPYIVFPLFMIGIYGLMGMLVAYIYNKFASKFGGLELVIEEKSEQNVVIKEEKLTN